MMKKSTKKIFILIAIILVAGIGYRGLKYGLKISEVKGKTLLTYIPAEISKKKPLVAVIGVNNFEDIYGNLKKTNFFKSLTNSDLYKKVIKESSFQWHLKHQKLELNLGKDISLKRVMDIIGKRFVIAIYKSKPGVLDYIFLSKIRDRTGVKEVLYKVLKDRKLTIDEHRGVGIESYSDNKFYTVLDGIFIAGNSVKLIKDIIDIKKKLSKLNNFNAVHPWVEDKMGPGDGFIFISHKELFSVIDGFSKSKVMIRKIGEPSILYTYQEFTLDRGIFLKSYGLLKKEDVPYQADSGISAPVSIKFIPERPLLAGISTNFNIKKWIGLSPDKSMGFSGEGPLNFIEDIIPYFGKEFGYAILGPSPESIRLVLPALFVFGETKDKDGQRKIADKISKVLNIQMQEVEYSKTKYKYAQIPVLFGQKIQVCVIPVDEKKKTFVIFATSRKTAENIIDLAKSRGKSFKQSTSWREISKHFPKKYSGFSYADVNALTRTVGLFIASLRGSQDLEDFLKTNPFSCVGPTGSAITYSQDYLVVHTYLSIQDLTQDKWKEIFNSINPLIF